MMIEAIIHRRGLFFGIINLLTVFSDLYYGSAAFFPAPLLLIYPYFYKNDSVFGCCGLIFIDS